MTEQEANRLRAGAQALGQSDRELSHFAVLLVEHLLRLDPPAQAAPAPDQAPVATDQAQTPTEEGKQTNGN